MNINQREIYLVPFPFTDFSQRKRRPVLILSQDEYIEDHPDVVCSAITSQEGNPECVPVDNSHLDSGHLKKDSYVLTDKIMTIEQSELIHSIGKLSVDRSKDVADEIEAHIEIQE